MEYESITSLKGQFLVAMPGLSDPNFSQTVTCICEHSGEGAMGLIINRAHDTLKSKDLYKELGLDFVEEEAGKQVYIGGPVHIGEVFILHAPPFEWEGTVLINNELAVSNTKDIIRAIAMGNGPKKYMISLGCAGWGANQLESEIRQNAWLTVPFSNDLIFDYPDVEKWSKSVERLGINPLLLSMSAGNA